MTTEYCKSVKCIFHTETGCTVGNTAEHCETVETQYNAARNADKAFQEALEAEYGGSAGDMRYSTKLPAHIGKLKIAYIDAMKIYNHRKGE